MQEYLFHVQGSAPEPYEVHFILRDSTNLSAYCTCPAGTNGMYCKHRVNILSGLKVGVVSSNVENVSIVQSWLAGTDIEKALQDIISLEKQADLIKKQLSAAKKILAKVMLS